MLTIVFNKELNKFLKTPKNRRRNGNLILFLQCWRKCDSLLKLRIPSRFYFVGVKAE